MLNKIGFLQTFTKFIGKHLWRTLFLNKVEDAAASIKLRQNQALMGGFLFESKNSFYRLNFPFTAKPPFNEKNSTSSVKLSYDRKT